MKKIFILFLLSLYGVAFSQDVIFDDCHGPIGDETCSAPKGEVTGKQGAKPTGHEASGWADKKSIYSKSNVIGEGDLQVNTCTGNLFLFRTDLYIPARGLDLFVTFSYNSGETKYDYGYGSGWTNNLNIVYENFGFDICIKRWDGNRDTFKFSSGRYTPPIGCYDSLTQYAPGKFRLRMKYGGEMFFDDSTHRKITRVYDRSGNTITLTYSGGYPILVTDANNRHLSMSWSGGRMVQIQDSIASPPRILSYEYNSDGDLIRVINPRGYSIQYGYDYSKRLILMINQLSTHFHIMYNESGAVTRIQSPMSDENFNYNPGSYTTAYTKNGSITYYTYDGNGRINEIQGACCGYHRQFTYDSWNNIVSVTDADGYITNYTYDSQGNQLTITDPLSQKIIYTYDPLFNQVTSATDKNGNTTTYTYDGNGYCTKILKPLGIELNYTYDGYGLITSYADGRGNTTTYTYDGNGYLTGITHPIGTESYTYDNVGNMLTHTDANGNVSTYIYNENNDMTAMQNALGEVTSYVYDGGGNITSLAYPDGNTTTYNYDALGRLAQITDNIGIVRTFGYDDAGNLISSTDGNGHTISFTYDGSNRLLSESRDGNTTTYTYDGRGNRLSATDGKGDVTTYTYDGIDRRLTSSVGGATTTTGYDANSNVTSLTDGKGNVTTYTYDGINRLTQETYPDGRTVNYTYDGNNNVVSRIAPDGKTTSYTYDASNRLTLRDFPGTNDDNYTYDDGGRMITATNGNASITYTYDVLNRKLSEEINSHTTSYIFNTPARQQTIIYPGGSVVQETYDVRGYLVDLQEGGININLAYDAGGRLSNISYDGIFNGSYSYNSRDLVTSLIYSRNGEIMAGYNYEYDNANNRTVSSDIYNDAQSEVYEYNSMDWLTSVMKGKLVGGVIPSPVDTFTYYYDHAGNWTSVDHQGVSTYTSNNLNQYTNISPGGALTFGPKGNLGQGINFNGSYDHENRLAYGADSTGEIWGDYKYDAIGRRVKKETNSGLIYYYYDGDRIIEERNDADVLTASYLYGDQGTDDLLKLNKYGNNYFYLKNALGSIVAMADDSGNVVERYNYNPFGVTTIISNLPLWCPGNIVQNGNFTDGAVYGSMPSGKTAHWTNAYGDPDVRINIGCGDSAFIGIWGNENPGIGEAVQQELTTPFIFGHTYSISFCGIWNKSAPTRIYPPKYVFRASNVPLTNSQDPNGVIIAVSDPVLDTDWVSVALPNWVATGNYSIITVSISNQSAVNHGDSITYSYIDRICIHDETTPKIVDSSIVGNHFMFTGREYDPEIRMYYYRTRHYDPQQGRFIQRDPLDISDNTSLYTYVDNNPPRFVDPFGLMKGEGGGAVIKISCAWECKTKFYLQDQVLPDYCELNGGSTCRPPNLLCICVWDCHFVCGVSLEVGTPPQGRSVSRSSSSNNESGLSWRQAATKNTIKFRLNL
jgi:RHS repeat-associated protein